MANEAILIIETGSAIPFTVAEDAGIEKGAVCMLSDLMTAATATGDEDYVAGIAASEKIADDGKVRLGLFREGIFKMVLSGTINAGEAVSTHVATGGAANLIHRAPITASGSQTLGIAMETGAEGETILVDLKPACLTNV